MTDKQRCQKCGCETKGEEAWVDGQIWCHPCADEVPPRRQTETVKEVPDLARRPTVQMIICSDLSVAELHVRNVMAELVIALRNAKEKPNEPVL